MSAEQDDSGSDPVLKVFRGGASDDWIYVGWPWGILEICADRLVLRIRYFWKTRVYVFRKFEIVKLTTSRRRILRSLDIHYQDVHSHLERKVEFIPLSFVSLERSLKEACYEIID